MNLHTNMDLTLKYLFGNLNNGTIWKIKEKCLKTGQDGQKNILK